MLRSCGVRGIYDVCVDALTVCCRNVVLTMSSLVVLLCPSGERQSSTCVSLSPLSCLETICTCHQSFDPCFTTKHFTVLARQRPTPFPTWMPMMPRQQEEPFDWAWITEDQPDNLELACFERQRPNGAGSTTFAACSAGLLRTWTPGKKVSSQTTKSKNSPAERSACCGPGYGSVARSH